MRFPEEPLRFVTSHDGSHSVTLWTAIQPIKYKDDHESVGVFRGAYQGQEVIVKVFLLLLGGRKKSIRAANETWALQMVTDANCEHAPRLIATFDRQLDGVMCDVEKFVIMSRLPGVLISETMLANRETHLKIRKAFAAAIKAVHGAGVDNNSPHDVNVLYDEIDSKCYSIDFERAQLIAKLGIAESNKRKRFDSWFDADIPARHRA